MGERDATNPIRTERAPKGVTRTGGAKVYAAKLATVQEMIWISQYRSVDYNLDPSRTFSNDHCERGRNENKREIDQYSAKLTIFNYASSCCLLSPSLGDTERLKYRRAM